MKYEYIECCCGCDAHTIRFTWDPDPEFPEIYMSIFLYPFYSFWKRLWLAIKYIFGRTTSKYGHFDETILVYEQIERLKDLCDRFLLSHIKKPISIEDKIQVAKMIVAMRKKALERAEAQLNEVCPDRLPEQEE